jgi:integrase
MKTHLTDIVCKTAKAPERGQTFLWDANLPAFGLRISQGGTKSWTVLRGQKPRRLTTIGRYPLVSLSEARLKAKHLLLEKETAPSLPFDQLLETFLAARAPAMKPNSHYEISRSLRRHFHWKKPLDRITHADVWNVIEGIEGKSEASHALKDIKSFFSWCVPRLIPHSPCEGLKPPTRYIPRDRLLSDGEVKRIWLAAQTMGGYGRQVQLLFSTGQRAGQIIGLKPEWIDAINRVITFPASIMKSNREHKLPYGEFTAALLASNEERPTSYQGKRKAELDKLADVHDWVLHDARRYYSSTHAKAPLKTPIDITEAILSHISGSRSQIQQIYDVYDRMDEMREAIEKYEARLLQLLAR